MRFGAVVKQKHFTLLGMRQESIDHALRCRLDSIHTPAGPGDYRLALSQRRSHRAPRFCPQRRPEHSRRSVDGLFNNGVRIAYLAIPVTSSAKHSKAGMIPAVIGDQMSFIAHPDQ
jgi:hypothetical protein